MLVIIFIGVAVFTGAFLAIRKINLIARISVYAVIFFGSGVLMSQPWFTDNPKTWLHTYVTGLFQLGVVSLAIHVIPSIIGYYMARYILRKK